jgi:hypothetical protein
VHLHNCELHTYVRCRAVWHTVQWVYCQPMHVKMFTKAQVRIHQPTTLARTPHPALTLQINAVRRSVLSPRPNQANILQTLPPIWFLRPVFPRGMGVAFAVLLNKRTGAAHDSPASPWSHCAQPAHLQRPVRLPPGQTGRSMCCLRAHRVHRKAVSTNAV